MSVKYRIRLQNNRVIGPFGAEEISELYLKKHINGDEVCQQFPIGDWRSFSSFPELVQFISLVNKTSSSIQSSPAHQEIKSEKNAATASLPVKNQTADKTSSIKMFSEFKFDKNKNLDENINYAEIEKKYNLFRPGERSDDEEIKKDEANDFEKTRIVRRSPFINLTDEMEKTVVIPLKAARLIKNETGTHSNIADDKKQKDVSREIKNTLPTREELINEQTEFFNLAHLLPTINAQLSVAEVELDQKARIEENNEIIRLKESQNSNDEDQEFDGDQDDSRSGLENNNTPKKKRKKGMSIIVAIAFLAIFYVMLTPDEKPKVSGPQFVEFKFPITQEFEDSNGAAKDLITGRNYYSQNTYLAKAVASKMFVSSLQKQFNTNEAIGDLILTYSELLDDTRDSKISANTIYKLIQLSDNKTLSDLNVVTGEALFFGKIGKSQSGINLIRNYFKAKGPASGKLLAYYLDLLISSGDLVEARKTFLKLNDLPKKTIEIYYSLANFSDVDDQPAQARKIIKDGISQNPKSALLLLKYADYLFKDQLQNEYESVLKKVNAINSEGSPSLTAKFYYHLGLLNALKNKNKVAASFFKKSLEIKESDDLRVMLASLEIAGDNFSKTLILESKVINLLKKAKVELKNKNLESAFSFSIEALDSSPSYVPAILLHTDLQIRRGLFDSAINTLQNAINTNPNNNLLKNNLTQAYIKAYKFDDAQKLLLELSQSKYSFGSDYASLMGDFYLAKNNIQLALRWYLEALNRDPLSDYDMFQVSKIFLRSKKFNEAKSRLSKALLLDPKNPDYLVMNSEILYEQDNADTALGYLRDAISEIGEDSKLLSAIAIIYYKSGQIKDFTNYYKRILALPKKDETFFEFLIYAAKLEEKNDDYINYSREILKLNPGNLKVHLELGEFLYNLKRYPEAIVEFDEVRTRLVSYPKVHFMLAKLYLATLDIKKAKVMALKELELNPSIDSAYYIVGEVARIEKDYREAIFKYEKAISLNPKSVEALTAMGWIKLAQNYASEAVELYGRALREDKNNPEIHKQLGFAYKAAGQRALAKEKLEDYLKLSPGAADRDQIETQIRNLQ
jgi:tetratricopeptide (TPR) repeat protein